MMNLVIYTKVKIDSFNFDIFNNKISFFITVFDDETRFYKVIFHDVSSFYFLKNNRENRFNIFEYEEGDYLEFTSIGYYPKTVGLINISHSDEAWTEQWYSSANFAIEIWSSMLFIEAKKIEINSKVYVLIPD